MSSYDVVITIKGKTIIGETTHSLTRARKRLEWEKGHLDGRIIDIIKDGNELIASSHPERLE